jgi:hypothetical protein
MIEMRRGPPPPLFVRAEFSARFRACLMALPFYGKGQSLVHLEALAWQAYREGRQVPFTRQAEYADPNHDGSPASIDTRVTPGQIEIHLAASRRRVLSDDGALSDAAQNSQSSI